jgi:hypothetical protein
MDRGGVSYPARYEATCSTRWGAQAEAEHYSLLAQLRSLLSGLQVHMVDERKALESLPPKHPFRHNGPAKPSCVWQKCLSWTTVDANDLEQLTNRGLR